MFLFCTEWPVLFMILLICHSKLNWDQLPCNKEQHKAGVWRSCVTCRYVVQSHVLSRAEYWKWDFTLLLTLSNMHYYFLLYSININYRELFMWYLQACHSALIVCSYTLIVEPMIFITLQSVVHTSSCNFFSLTNWKTR